jgi:hypothetical protein
MRATYRKQNRCPQMELEIRALFDEAARCRRTADEIAHSRAAERLRSMAEEYRARAVKLQDQSRNSAARDSVRPDLEAMSRVRVTAQRGD